LPDARGGGGSGADWRDIAHQKAATMRGALPAISSGIDAMLGTTMTEQRAPQSPQPACTASGQHPVTSEQWATPVAAASFGMASTLTIGEAINARQIRM
jgi:hypothetical protein